MSRAPTAPDIIRVELPTPDMVIVRTASRLMMFADTRVSDLDVHAAVADLDVILEGLPYCLCCFPP